MVNKKEAPTNKVIVKSKDKKKKNDTSLLNISALQKISEEIAGTGEKINKEFPAIEVKGYTKKFRKFVATKDVTFTVGHGVIHGFIGPNGSGKTTTIKAMIGAYLATEGSILINGHKAGSIDANKLIGYIPERASFPSYLNTMQYLTNMGELSGLKKKVAKKRSAMILEALGLQDHAKRKPSSFSSGMQKKILLAQSLLNDPKILILDEPAANLDPTSRKELFDQLMMLRDQGKTIIISSHILSELERLIDEVTFLFYGEVISTGPTKAFNKRSSSVFIRAQDNEELIQFLKSKKYNINSHNKTEIEVPNVTRETADKILKEISLSNIKIISYRSNDLQSVYDDLVQEANEKHRGNQMIGKKKSIAMKRSK